MRRLITATATAIAICALALGPSAAFGESGNESLNNTAETQQTCTDPLVEQPFWVAGDGRDYVMAPGGNFENDDLPGWQIRGGGDVKLGNEDATLFAAGGNVGLSSLLLPKGASAVSPAMCVDLNYPIFRFVSKATNLTGEAKLAVDVIYPDAPDPAFEQVASFNPSKLGWRISDDFAMSPERGGAVPAFRRAGFRFRVLSGSVRLDNLYVDPKRH